MGSRTYLCSIYSDNTTEDRVYTINHRSAVRAAEKYGRCEGNETVTVRTHTGQILSKAVWNQEQRKYINVAF